MSTRKYNDHGIKASAALIASEIILNGSSQGWAGSLEDKEAVEKALAPFGIRYTDDMVGEWKGPKERFKCAGGIVFDAEGRVLLREVANHHKGYTWTFPKGRLDKGETLEECALREVLEEAGVVAEIVGKLPGVYSGLESETTYFIMRLVSDTGTFDKETSAVRWCTEEAADELLATIQHEEGRKRDREVLTFSFISALSRGLRAV